MSGGHWREVRGGHWDSTDPADYKVLISQTTRSAGSPVSEAGVIQVRLQVTIPTEVGVTEAQVEEAITAVLVAMNDQTGELFGRPVSDGYSTEGS